MPAKKFCYTESDIKRREYAKEQRLQAWLENQSAKLSELAANGGCACGCGRTVGTPIYRVASDTGRPFWETDSDDPFDGPNVDKLYDLGLEHFEWDHHPGMHKVAPISRLVSTGRRTAAAIERAKCQLLYVGCHRHVTFKRDQQKPKNKRTMTR